MGEGARLGGCLCGALRFSARPVKSEMDVCQYGMCRRWNGSVFMAVRRDAVSFQAFDDPTGFVFAEEFFVDDKPAVYDFANATRKMTGAQVVAHFANQQGA